MNRKLLTLIASVSVLTTQAQTAEPYTHTYTVGDFDGDGKITVADMTHMVSIISGIIPAQKVTNAAGTLTLDGAVKSAVIIGDMNNDGKLDEKDLLAQLDVTLGKALPKPTTLTLEVAPKDYDKLNEYGSMKDFVNRIDYPNFKVAAAVNANEFNQQDNLFNYAVANLDEVVADNAMKMSSVVGNNGSMNFSTVTDFVNKATEAGLNVYGHTLAWHSQQPVAWLKSVVESAGEFPYIINRDFSSSDQKLGGWGGSATRDIVDGAFVISNPEASTNNWDIQTAVDLADVFEMGVTYTLSMRIKSDAEGTISAGFQNTDGYKGCGDFESIGLTTDWQEVKLECTVTGEGAKRFLFSHGHVTGNIYIDDLKLFAGHIGDDDAFYGDRKEQIEEVFFFDFTNGEQGMNSWGNNSTREARDGVFIINNPSESANTWDVQVAVDGYTFTEGATYTLSLKVRTDSESEDKTMSIGFQQQDGYAGRGDFPSVTLTSDWQEVNGTCTVNDAGADRLLFNLGKIAGNVYFDDIKLTTKIMTEDDSTEGAVFAQTYTDGDFPFYPMGCEPPVVDGSIHFVPTGDWSQFFCTNAHTLEAGDYKARLRIKSSKAGTIKLVIQNGWSDDAQKVTQSITVAADWQTVTVKFSDALVGGDYEMILQAETFDGIIDLESVAVFKDENLEKEALIGAMQKWINGMMQATQGKVKAWDMINEAIAGDGNVNGYYDLQHAAGGGGTWDVGGQTFYWQDYFGSKEYGVIVEKLAREAYAKVEGTNPDDLKLFINDYNLEGTWDNCKKLESLIYWIGVWEKGGAKIDGIGTQMHISYYKDATSQQNQKNAITRMFTLMANTGKYVRVSELDMGIYDKQFGNKITQLTEADQIAMAEYYQWIIQEYFRIVPKAQQWGICQWCLNDAPANSGWRDGEPVGILDLQGNRKDSYVGWAEGLKTTWK